VSGFFKDDNKVLVLMRAIELLSPETTTTFSGKSMCHGFICLFVVYLTTLTEVQFIIVSDGSMMPVWQRFNDPLYHR
jgi:hypothetical protein